MRTILRFKWLLLALWIVAAAGLMLGAPNMEELVREKGQISVPDGESSVIASKLAEEIGKEGGSAGEATVLAFHKDEPLSAADLEEVRRGVDKLKTDAGALGVSSVTTHFDTPELKEQMVSEDGKTVLALLSVDLTGREAVRVQESLYAELEDIRVEHYYTGNWIINEDVIASSQEGLKKTEFITVGFILVILFIVFRSAVAPLVPLLAVGFSYLVSQSVVAYLVHDFDFPLSNFTQIFLVAVLFGIGTDYCILLISRYKEELAHRGDRTEAIVATYRSAGRTVLVSGAAVLVGFVSIGFSTFVLYRSAVAVAVGVAVLLLALITLVPFFMAVLGKGLFWPARGAMEHKPSKVWETVGRFSLRKPAWALLILAVLIVPFLVAYKGTISYNSLDEIGERYDSVKAFNIIADSFGPGDSLPTTVVVKSGKPLDSSAGLAAIERMSRELEQVDGVKAVRSATRPTGEVTDDFLVGTQAEQLKDGIGQSGDGIGRIGTGLSDASKALSANAPKLSEAAAGAERLQDGTAELKSGIVRLGDGLKQLERGLRDGSAGAGELSDGLKQAQASAEQLSAASRELLANYGRLGTGLGQLSQAYGAVAGEQAKLAEGLAGLHEGLSSLAESNPGLADDPAYRQALGTALELQRSAAGIGGRLAELNGQLAGLAAGMEQANAGYAQASEGQEALAGGLAKLAAGIAELQAGIERAADGQGQIVSQLPGVTGGIDRLAAGQKQLADGFAELNGQLGELTGGLDQSVDGLNRVSDGLKSAEGYLDGLTASPDKQLSGWYLPEEAAENEQFRDALDVYMSPDRMTAKLDVVFDGNPYERDTMSRIDDLEAAASRALKGTEFGGATFAVGGVTSMNNDLSNVSSADYSRTVMLMLIGIALILILLFRSIVIPVYLIASLLVTYYTSLAITEAIFVRLLGYTGVSWAVPFFGFVMLVALGIDYSIFLMDRFKEYRYSLSPSAAILEAMRHMGTVIMSAAVILGGTFAAMLPSGVMSLLQIASVVLCGLFLYALVMLPLFVPVMVRTFGQANWWPFMGRGERAEEREGIRAIPGDTTV